MGWVFIRNLETGEETFVGDEPNTGSPRLDATLRARQKAKVGLLEDNFSPDGAASMEEQREMK